MKVLAAMLLVGTTFAYAQQTLTLKYFGLTVHPAGDYTADLQPFKLDDRAVVVMNFGGFIGYERFVHQDLVSVKYILGAFSDCSGGLATVNHIGIRGALYKTEKHKIYLGIGPTLMVRDSWKRFGEVYTSSGYFNDYDSKNFGELQWKLIPYGLEFEYDYAFNPKNHLSVSCTPGIPLAAILSVGWKHWFQVPEYKQYKIYKPKK